MAYLRIQKSGTKIPNRTYKIMDMVSWAASVLSQKRLYTERHSGLD